MHEDYSLAFAILRSDNCFQYAMNGNIPHLKYLVGTNGMGLTKASLNFFLTSTLTAVPFLWDPLAMYPMAMFVPSVGEGIPEVITPIFLFFFEKERRRAKVSGIQECEVLQKDQRSALTNFLFTQRIQDFATFSRWGAYNLKADPSPGRSVGKFLEDSRFSRERRLSVGRASVLA